MLYPWRLRLGRRFPAIVQAASRIKAQSFLIDGEVLVCRDDGFSDFKALHSADATMMRCCLRST